MKGKLLLLLLSFSFPFGFSGLFAAGAQAGPQGDVQIINMEGDVGREVVYIQDDRTEVQICQLIPGETYYFQAVQMQGCQPLLELPGTGKAPQSAFNILANASCQTVYVLADYLRGGCSGAMYLTMACNSCKPKTSAESGQTRSPISIQSGTFPTVLVEDVFIGGGCFDISGAMHKGSPVARGIFSSGFTSVGLEKGIILSSGPVTVATGPNNNTGAGGGVGGGSDIDLVQAAGQGTTINDASVLEFDFKPTVSQIEFNYVFASEEYCDFVNSGFNDVFGFFISGPGFNGPYSNNGVNLAVLPGLGLGGTPVSINNVNHITNSVYYVGNIPAGSGQLTNPNCQGHPISGPPATDECQYDGFTRVLTAVANVIPCQTYHIKLAVGDAADNVFDSAVFLEANSFDAGGDVEVTATVPPAQGTTAYEGCSNGFFTFFRTAGDPTVPLVINYTITGTATSGADYAPLPLTITIPANQNSIQIPVTVFDDVIPEGTETITITLSNPCNCSTSTATINIVDPTPVNVDIDINPVCKGNPFSITPTITGGAPPYTYAWNPAGSNPVYNGIANNSGVYTVTVTDFCGSVDVDTANVEVYTISATISGSTGVCPGGPPGYLTVTFTGIGPWSFTYQASGGSPGLITGITQNPYQLPVFMPGNYVITSVNNGVCTGTVSGVGVATIPVISLSTVVTPVECFGGTTGAIDLTVSGGTNPYTYNWNNNAHTQDLQNLAAGVYVVNVIDSKGCFQVISAQITQPPDLTAAASVLSGVNCDNPTGGSIDLTVAGGTPGYTYLWNNSANTQDLTGLTAGTYTVTVTDNNDCTETATVVVPGDASIPSADFDVLGVINCANNALTLDGSASSSGPNYVYQWIASGGGAITGDPGAPVTSAQGAGTYELIVTDTLNDCFTAASVVVTQDLNTPVADAGPGQVITCLNGVVLLNGTGSTSGPGISYNWSTSNGNFTSSTNIPAPTADAAGDYLLVVTNTQNGCADSSLVSVTADLAAPTAAAGQDGVIDCDFTVIQLDGTGSSAGPGFTYLWSTSDGNILGDPGTIDPSVDQAGTYTLLVTNTNNGCTSTDEVEVSDLSIDPLIQIATPPTLTCALPETALDATGSDSGAGIVYNWAGLNGGTILSGDDTPTPLIGSAGTYELTLTNTLTGCISVETVDVTDDLTLPAADAGPALTISCSLPDLQLDGTASSAGPGISYVWTALNGGNIVSGEDTATPTVNSAGLYVLTVTDSGNGCLASDSVQVQLDTDAPVAVAAASQQLDCQNSQVLISGVGSTFGPDISYSWTTADGNILFGDGSLWLTVDAPGTYTLTVTNGQNDCSSLTAVTLGIDTLAPIALVAAPGDLTCAVSSIILDGSGSSQGPEYTYLWTTPDGNISGPADVPNPLADQPGAYHLLVTDTGNGCTSETSIDVTEDTTLPAAEAGPTAELTCGTTSLSLNGSGSASGAGISYTWTTAGGNIVSGGATTSPLVDAPGAYQITVLNAVNGCSASDQVVITQNITPPAALVAQPGLLTCQAITISLDGTLSTGSGSLNYAWSTSDGNIVGPAGIATPTVDQPGVYQLVVTQNNNLCQDTVLVTVSQDIEQPLAEAGPSFELDCGTTSLSLDGVGSSTGPEFSYLWSTVDGIIDNGGTTLAPTVSAAGTYVLTVLDNSNGCTNTDQVEVTLDAATPVADAGAGQELNCDVTLLTLDGSASSQGAGLIYQWSTSNGNIVSGGNGLSPLVDAPGTYILTVINTQNNCQSSSPVLITEDVTLPVADAGATAVVNCSDPAVTLNAGASSQGPDFSYVWTTIDGNIISGGNTLTPQVDQQGTYTLTVTDNDNGCTASDATTVTFDQAPPSVVLQTPAELTCTVTSLTLGASGTSTGPDFSYLWTTADGQITGGSTTLSPTVDEPGTYTLTVTNNENGCVASQSVTVLEDANVPTAEAGATAELTCAVTTLQLSGAGSSTGAGFEYEWTAGPGGVIQSGANTLTPTVSAPGTYTLTVLNALNNCSETDMVTITEDVADPLVVIGTPPMLTCLDEQVSLDATGSDSGTDFDLSWSTNGGNIINTADPLHPLVDEPGSYTLTILDLDNGCTSSLTISVDEDIDPPGADAGPVFLLHCNLPQVQLQGSSGIGAGGQYSWSTADGQIVGGGNTAQPLVGAPGTYSLTVTNPLNGCSSADQVTVTESNPEDFDIELDPPVCLGFPGDILFGQVLGGTPPYQYSIDGGLSFSSQVQFTGLEPGTYDLIVRDANGCDLSEEVVLTEGSEVTLDLDSEVLLDLGQSFQVQVFLNIDPSDIESITWEPDLFLSCNDCLDPVVTPQHQVDYVVTVVTEEGCAGEAKIGFRVNKQANVFIPSIFTPNGDGENDIFMIFGGNQVAEVRQFLVFNRWGESVYEYEHFKPNDPAFGWNGLHRGQEVNSGVFAWFAEIEMIDGRVELYEGSVALVR